MTRPKPMIIQSQEQDNGDEWQILQADQTYVITFKGQPVDIRVVCHSLSVNKFKYKRTSYNQLGTVLAQVKRYNKMFNTEDFDYITV